MIWRDILAISLKGSTHNKGRFLSCFYCGGQLSVTNDTLGGFLKKKWPGGQENAVFVTRTLSKSRNGESREQKLPRTNAEN